MSRGVNKVILLGNLGKDPEMRATPGGTTIAQFSLATSDRRRDAKGEWQDAVEWHNIVCFNRVAEIARDYLKKGSQVYMEGKLQTRSWEDKEGKRQYRTEILVNELVLLGAPVTERDNGGYRKNDNPAYNREMATAAAPRYPAQQEPLEITDDDIPF